MVFLSETKLSSSKFEVIKRKVGFSFSYGVGSDGRSGRIRIIWRTDGIENSKYYKNFIDTFIREKNGE